MTHPAFVSISSHDQVGGTCYANAVATVIRATENRIIGRTPESHQELVDKIVSKHGSNGAHTYTVLKEECDKRQLRCKQLSQSDAIKIVKKRQRPIIATFRLNSHQWSIFSAHFARNGTSVLAKYDMVAQQWDSTNSGHAICVTGVNTAEKYWYIKNSWGQNWADGGCCRISFDAVSFKYYDCYFLESDLTEKDKAYPILKDYSSLTMLGKGTFGDVYKGTSVENNEFVAIKKMNTSDYKLVKRELLLLSKCKCKYVIKLLNEHCYNNYHWIVLEYCSNGSIEGRTGKCNERELKKIAFDVLSAVSYLHSQKVIHRDIKPSNILHSSDGIYKLADFGASKDLQQTLRRTLDIGTSYFMAPEIITQDNGKGYDETVDIWSFGVTMYRLITNKFPFDFKKKSYLAIATKIVKENPHKLDTNQLNEYKFEDAYGISDIINNKCLVKGNGKRCSAEQLLQHSWFDNDEKSESTSLMAYCESIKDVVKHAFPSAYEVWKQEPEGTIAFLKGKGIIEAQELLQEFDMEPKEGTDNIQAWTEYKDAIYEYLTEINNDERLQEARKTLANEIWKLHYKRFPQWPTGWPFNTTNTDTILLDKKDKYVYKNKWFIAWSIGGSITVTDYHPSRRVYKAKFSGKPTFRVLKVDNQRFGTFNALCAGNMAKAIENVKQFSNYSAALTWESL